MLTLSIDAKQLNAELKRLRTRIPLEIARGLNEGGDKVRTQTQRTLQKQTSLLRYNSVTGRLRTARAFPEQQGDDLGMRYVLTVDGKPTKPHEFRWRVETGPGGGVVIRMWGADHKFKRSFMEKDHPGALGLRARLGKERLPLRSFDGPNLAREAVKEESARTFLESAETLVLPMIEKRLERLIR
jgi:hypothetical protein